MNREQWNDLRSRPMGEVLTALHRTAPEVFEHNGGLPPLRVVGRWLWCYFPDKPTPATRDALKAEGFCWSNRRQGWAHPCGVFTAPGRGDPREKYGEIGADELEVA